MRCERCRELVSARLDSEPEDGPAGAVDAHLAGCPDCRAWAERAAAVTRLARTGPAVPVPDLTAAVVAAAATSRPVVRRRRTATAVRWLLAAVGAGQLALAAVGVAGAATGGQDLHVAGAGMAHVAHETSAWNLALGIGFLAVAWYGGRLVAGLLPVTGAFVAVLAVLSVVDLVAGRVEPDRLATHALVVAGFLLLLLHRRVLGDDGRRARRRPALPWAAGHGDGPTPLWNDPAPGSGAVARDDRAA